HLRFPVEAVLLARNEHGRRPVREESERDDVTLRVIVAVKGEAAHLGRHEKDGAFGKCPGVLERPAHARRAASAPEPPDRGSFDVPVEPEPVQYKSVGRGGGDAGTGDEDYVIEVAEAGPGAFDAGF